MVDQTREITKYDSFICEQTKNARSLYFKIATAMTEKITKAAVINAVITLIRRY